MKKIVFSLSLMLGLCSVQVVLAQTVSCLKTSVLPASMLVGETGYIGFACTNNSGVNLSDFRLSPINVDPQDTLTTVNSTCITNFPAGSTCNLYADYQPGIAGSKNFNYSGFYAGTSWGPMLTPPFITNVTSVPSYTVTANSRGEGSVSPLKQNIASGSSAKVTITTQGDSSAFINTATTCIGTLTGNQYTTKPITAPCEVIVTFLPVITVTSIANLADGTATGERVGGTGVLITGSGFNALAGRNLQVKFGDTLATAVSIVDDGSIKANTPASSGTDDVNVSLSIDEGTPIPRAVVPYTYRASRCDPTVRYPGQTTGTQCQMQLQVCIDVPNSSTDIRTVNLSSSKPTGNTRVPSQCIDSMPNFDPIIIQQGASGIVCTKDTYRFSLDTSNQVNAACVNQSNTAPNYAIPVLNIEYSMGEAYADNALFSAEQFLNFSTGLGLIELFNNAYSYNYSPFRSSPDVCIANATGTCSSSVPNLPANAGTLRIMANPSSTAFPI